MTGASPLFCRRAGQGGAAARACLERRELRAVDVRPANQRERHLILHIAVRALRALQDIPQAGGKPMDEMPEIPIRLFISHAKTDLPADPAAIAEGPVKAILATLAQLPVQGWYDGAEIPPGGRFPEEIQNGVLSSSALVAVLTDTWSSREWCRREVLEAKLAARPLVVVDALQARVIRLFPYLGNSVTLRWRAAIVPPETADDAWSKCRTLWQAEDAALVIEAALLEALRYQHVYRHLLRFTGANEVALGTPPEALTLAHLPAGTTRVWYPDPPLGREELDQLQPSGATGSGHKIDLTTPLGELARWNRPPGIQTIAVSLSNSPDTDIYGGSPEHLATFADDILLYLLLAALRVAYGGVLGDDDLHKGERRGRRHQPCGTAAGNGAAIRPERRRRQAVGPYPGGSPADPLQTATLVRTMDNKPRSGIAASARPRRHGPGIGRSRQWLRVSRHARPALRLDTVIDLHAGGHAGGNIRAHRDGWQAQGLPGTLAGGAGGRNHRPAGRPTALPARFVRRCRAASDRCAARSPARGVHQRLAFRAGGLGCAAQQVPAPRPHHPVPRGTGRRIEAKRQSRIVGGPQQRSFRR